MRRCVVIVFMFTLTACAAVSPERAAEQDAMWDAARECQARFSTITAIQRIDAYGQLYFTHVGSGRENAAFLACYQQGVKKRLGSTHGLHPGRLSDATQKLVKVTVPVTEVGNHAYVTTTLNAQHQALLLLDTGATLTILSPALAARLGITPGPGARMRTAKAAGGSSFSFPVARLESLKIGAFIVEGLDVGVYDVLSHRPNVGGILGADVLHHFKTSLDLGARTLTLENRVAPVVTPGQPDASATVRAPVWSVGDQWTYRVENRDGVRTSTYVVRGFEAVDGVECWVVRAGRREYYHRREDLATMLEKLDGALDRHYRPAIQLFHWPLGVGRSWDDRYTIELPGQAPSNRAVTVTVESEEEVKVPAGTFRALRIMRRPGPRSMVFTEGWYAPAVKFWVRQHEHLPSGIRIHELTAYKVR